MEKIKACFIDIAENFWYNEIRKTAFFGINATPHILRALLPKDLLIDLRGQENDKR